MLTFSFCFLFGFLFCLLFNFLNFLSYFLRLLFLWLSYFLSYFFNFPSYFLFLFSLLFPVLIFQLLHHLIWIFSAPWYLYKFFHVFDTQLIKNNIFLAIFDQHFSQYKKIRIPDTKILVFEYLECEFFCIYTFEAFFHPKMVFLKKNQELNDEFFSIDTARYLTGQISRKPTIPQAKSTQSRPGHCQHRSGGFSFHLSFFPDLLLEAHRW